MESFEKFYLPQPELGFIDRLRSPVHTAKPKWFCRKNAADGEADAEGLYIVNNFPDEENLLETAIEDFGEFSKVYEIGGNRYPIVLQYCETKTFEEYVINVTKDKCTVSAMDTEGIRRGIIYIEDELNRRGGAFLPLGEIVRTPRIKTRITRGFFSPTNRPPKNIDELFDNVDYYPEQYLNRLAHDGTNGLWIYTRLSDLVKTDIIPEYGAGREKRIAKLKKIIAKAKRYGIKVYIFFIEPYYLDDEQAKKYPELVGYKHYTGKNTFCVHTEKGKKYCITAMETLCRELPDIGGFIDITYGERTTSCASGDTSNCPRCKKYSRAQVVAHTVDLLKEGIRRAGSNAKFISWPYGHRTWELDEISDYVKASPDDVVQMENFEEMGVETQLGKERLAVDYWLSYTGPSNLFKAAMNQANKDGKEMYAKIQACCSHEIATLPYIPVPGILFEKLKVNIVGMMECWYFGNYPSLMSKAAGELSFLWDFSDKKGFLKNLAAIYCGYKNSEMMAKAYELFEEGYKNYPVNIMFSYYGPMHDSVVWELQLEPKNANLPQSWMYEDAANGDRIWECLQKGHTLDEAVTLFETMTKLWKEGKNAVPNQLVSEQKSVIDAFEILADSCKNILEFYYKRDKLLYGEGDAEVLLEEMKAIVDEEIINSSKMIPLCENDSRLGYHSEAESYKFFPEQLKKRIKALEKLKETEFKRALDRVKNGQKPIEIKIDYEKHYQMAHSIENAQKEQISENGGEFRCAYDEKYVYLEIAAAKHSKVTIGFEPKPMRYSEVVSLIDGTVQVPKNEGMYLGLTENRKKEELEKYIVEYVTDENKDTYRVKVDREKLGWDGKSPLGFKLVSDWDFWCRFRTASEWRLGFASFPCEFGALLP